MIKNIIFDYGGVVIDLEYDRTRKAFEKLGVRDFDLHFTQLRQTPLFDDLDTAKVSEREFRDRLNQQIGMNLSDEEIDEAWNAMLIGIKDEKLKELWEIRKNHKIFLLSNTNFIHLKAITKYLIRNHGRTNLDDLFDKVHYSCSTGFRKPNPEIYHKVLNDSDLKAAETLYIDDSPQHVEGAKAVGMHAVLYTPDKTLQETIRQYEEQNQTMVPGEVS